MKLTTETLNKTIEVLKAELRDVYQQEKDFTEEQTKLFTIGSFAVTKVEDYSWGEKNDYRVRFELKSKLSELFDRFETIDFEIRTQNTFAHEYSWSGWSCRSMTTQEESETNFKKALAYMTYTTEKIDFLAEYNKVYAVTQKAKEHYMQFINPLQEKAYELKRQILEAQNEIENIKKQEELDTAKSVLIDGAEFKMEKEFFYTARKCSYKFKIQANKKGQLYLHSNNEWSDEKDRVKLTDDMMLKFYKHINKVLISKDYNFNTKDYKYLKTNNLLTTDEPVWETITKEEYDTIRKSR